MKTIHYTAEQEYAQKVADTWRMNDERNKRIEAKRQRMQELDDIALIEEGDYCD
jgi:hypothetical protein